MRPTIAMFLRIVALMTCVWSAVGAAFLLMLAFIFIDDVASKSRTLPWIISLLIVSIGLGYTIMRQTSLRIYHGIGLLIIIGFWIYYIF